MDTHHIDQIQHGIWLPNLLDNESSKSPKTKISLQLRYKNVHRSPQNITDQQHTRGSKHTALCRQNTQFKFKIKRQSIIKHKQPELQFNRKSPSKKQEAP